MLRQRMQEEGKGDQGEKGLVQCGDVEFEIPVGRHGGRDSIASSFK